MSFSDTHATMTDMEAPHRPSLAGHIQIARIDHWFKNVFVLPGIAVAVTMDPGHTSPDLWKRVVLGAIAICLNASSYYTLNEVLDAPFDRLHPVKCRRPVPSGKVHVPLAYAQWIGLMLVGVGIASLVSTQLAMVLFALWTMGCLYNIPPIRTKDLPYLDVLSEAVNNPLRMLAGWYLAGPQAVAPASLLVSYWMLGAYFMAMKRYAEYRNIDDPSRAAAYRKSFAYYNPERLMVSIMFYGTASMLFLGSFIMRYRLELILAFPLLAWVMATYLSLAFKDDSAVQRPEGLYREPKLMMAVVMCTALMGLLLVVDIPAMHTLFSPTAPVAGSPR